MVLYLNTGAAEKFVMLDVGVIGVLLCHGINQFRTMLMSDSEVS